MKQPTKNIKIGSDILNIIGNMTWRLDGSQVIGFLNSGQLDRETYVKLNKVLVNLGGRWDRKSSGHVFSIMADPRERIADILDVGELTVVKDGFYETPKEVVLKMLALLEKTSDDNILEPSAGLGAIISVLLEEGFVAKAENINVCEFNDIRADTLIEKGCTLVGKDFLEYNANKKYTTIIMNPPFEVGQDLAHVTHAFENCLADGGELVSVMSAGVRFRTGAKYDAFRDLVNNFGRFESLPENSFKVSGTNVNAVLVYLSKNK